MTEKAVQPKAATYRELSLNPMGVIDAVKGLSPTGMMQMVNQTAPQPAATPIAQPASTGNNCPKP